MKTQAENPNGLHLRYIVTRANGEPTDPRAEYFVLRTDKAASDQRHTEACRRALLTYADEIEPFLPTLAQELREKHGGSSVRAEMIDLRRRVENQKSHISAFAQCLDGLMTPEQQAAIPGSGIDGARDARNLRAIVSKLMGAAAPSNVVHQPTPAE